MAHVKAGVRIQVDCIFNSGMPGVGEQIACAQAVPSAY
jgi:hypothetical protein